MDKLHPGTYLIVTADDFGISPEVNDAVKKASHQGILTCASLMVSGNAAKEGIEMAKELPSLQVSLHLNLTEGHPVSSVDIIPDLVGSDNCFLSSLVMYGFFLQFSKHMQRQIEIEVNSQFRAFLEAGLPFTHVDCHHHFYIHPKLFDIVLKWAVYYKLRSIRIPYEPWYISGRICTGHTIRNLFFRNVFKGLAAICRKKARSVDILSADGVFGLYQTGHITEKWVLKLLDRLQWIPGIFELYVHPSIDKSSPGYQEFRMLVSSAVRDKVEKAGIKLIRYKDIEDLMGVEGLQ